MRTVRRILIGISLLMTVAGLVLLVLPYDASVQGPSLAGQPATDVTVSCRAPIVDLVTHDEGDAWFNYTPNEGVVLDSSSGHAGGEFCNDTMQTRGISGIVLLMGAACIALASYMVRARRSDGADPEAPDDPAAPVRSGDDGAAGADGDADRDGPAPARDVPADGTS